MVVPLKGIATYGTYLLIGSVYSIPVAINVLWKAVTRPHKIMTARKWAALEFPDPVSSVQHEYYNLDDDITIHAVRTGGAEAGKPVMLFVHGFPEYWGSWRYQIEHFRKYYDVIAIDMRGYGRSSKPKGVGSYTMNKLIDDIAGVVKAAGADKVVLCGHDWGGAVCWNTAIMRPDVVDKLVIACAPHPAKFDLSGAQFFRSWYMFAFQIPFLPELMVLMDDNAVFNDSFSQCKINPMTQQDIAYYKKEFARPGAKTAAINYYRAAFQTKTIRHIPALHGLRRKRVSAPTLLLWGENDMYLGQQFLPGTEKYVDTLKVHVLKGTSHWAQQDNPEEFNKVMGEFLQS